MREFFMALMLVFSTSINATTSLPIQLTTPQEAEMWRNMNTTLNRVKQEAEEKVQAAKKEAEGINEVAQKSLSEQQQKIDEAIAATKRQDEELLLQRIAAEKKLLEDAHAAKLAELGQQYAADKKKNEEILFDEFAEHEQHDVLQRRFYYAVSGGLCGLIVLYHLIQQRREVAATVRAIHHDPLINWHYEVPLASIKSMTEEELAKDIIATYFADPAVARQVSPASPVERVLQGVDDRIKQLQSYLGWHNRNAFLRWLAGVDTKLIGLAQERLARLVIVRDVLYGYRQ